MNNALNKQNTMMRMEKKWMINATLSLNCFIRKSDEKCVSRIAMAISVVVYMPSATHVYHNRENVIVAGGPAYPNHINVLMKLDA